MDFIKEVIKDLYKRKIYSLNSNAFYLWCRTNDFIPANIAEEIYNFKKTEEGQRFIIQLQGEKTNETNA